MAGRRVAAAAVWVVAVGLDDVDVVETDFVDAVVARRSGFAACWWHFGLEGLGDWGALDSPSDCEGFAAGCFLDVAESRVRRRRRLRLRGGAALLRGVGATSIAPPWA